MYVGKTKKTNYIKQEKSSFNIKKKENTSHLKNKHEQSCNINFDTQFWIFYYLLEGEDNYILNNKNFKKKQNIIYDVLQNILQFKSVYQNTAYYKKNKLIESFTNIDNNDIDLCGFSFLCTINKIIFFVKNKQFYFTNYPDYSESLNIHEDEINNSIKKFVFIDEEYKKIQCVEENEWKLKLKENIENRVYVKNPNKLIYSITNYKLQELYDLANTLNINYHIKSKKADVYKNICDNIISSLFFKMK
tara:strand:- start:912 stop:1652 length:741 start_codon:yes stop_codon:yes gene_type:complete